MKVDEAVTFKKGSITSVEEYTTFYVSLDTGEEYRGWGFTWERLYGNSWECCGPDEEMNIQAQFAKYMEENA